MGDSLALSTATAQAIMQLTVKPKNARSKRALKAREPKLKESAKTAIFVRGQQTSEAVKIALSELMQMKKPDAVTFSKANAIHPFEDANSLAFWSKKNDASLFMVGLHSKKRPNNLVFARMYDNEVLDMLELGIEMAKSMREFKATKAAVGQRPLFHFAGELFDTHPLYQQFKSVILDFFHGEEVDKINLAGLEHVISCTVGAQSDEIALANSIPTQPITSLTDPSTSTGTSASASAGLPVVHFRTYTTKLMNSGTRTPIVKLEAVGPDFDFRLRRTQPVDGDPWKQATKKPKKAALPGQIAGQKRKDRNVDIDEMGDKVGRIHVGKQDLSKLQSRKMKGLKKGREADGDDDDADADGPADAAEAAEDGAVEEGVDLSAVNGAGKRRRT